MALKQPEDILNCWLVNMANTGQITWQNWFKAAKIQNYQQHKMWSEVSSSDLALSAVLSGHGIALVSTALISQYVDVGTLVVPFDIKHPVSFKRCLIFDPNSAKIARIDVFRRWMELEMAEH
jgi:LysR family glycine cleavage system transcriptional activator